MINDIITLLPEGLREEPLYIKVVEILTHILTENELDFNDILYKFKDFDQLHEEALESLISEFGYGYITEVLALSTTEIKTLSTFLYLIHSLKGHKDGLELILTLLGLDYTLSEWWEQEPLGTPDTFNITAYVSLVLFSFSDIATINTNLAVFIENYVYPITDEYNVRASLTNNSGIPYCASVPCIGITITTAT